VGSSTLALVDKLLDTKNSASASKTPAKAVKSATTEASTPVSAAVAATGATAASGGDSADKAASAKPKGTKTASDYALKWFGKVEDVFARGETATVYDIETGKSFKIKRTYGSNHADCETLTKKDTAVMKKIYGGTWSWERREIIVKVELIIMKCI
jgi:hypothetical protein